MVVVAGGGGGGIVPCFADIERAVSHMGGDAWPRESSGIFDYIAVNRWNQDYKRDTLKEAIKSMVGYQKRPVAVNVVSQPDYKILITFEDNQEKVFDIKPFLEDRLYEDLKDLDLFNKVKISGHKVEWRPRLDIDISDL
jgi:hypothetical protein